MQQYNAFSIFILIHGRQQHTNKAKRMCSALKIQAILPIDGYGRALLEVVMNVNANLKAINHIATSQQVSANNIANSQSNNFQASRVVQTTDKVSISPEARIAAQDMVQMTINESGLSANVKAIQTQDQMDQALFSLKK